MNDIVDDQHLDKAAELIKTLAVYKEAEDLINIGAYVEGSDSQIDFAKDMISKINPFLQQDIDAKITFKESVERLQALFD